MTSASVAIWRDSGYTEGAVNVPSKTSSLPTPTFTFTLPSISRATLFSEFTVKAAYEDLYDCSYLKMTLDMNNGEDVTVYGWIDSVSCSSDTANSPAVSVRWHIDYWRTYAFQALYGSGMVRRRPLVADEQVPPQPYPFRYREVGTSRTVIASTVTWWVIVNLSTTVGGSLSENATGGAILTWPVYKTDDPTGYSYKLKVSNTENVPCLSFGSLIRGDWDELLGLDPTAVKSVFLSPVAPCQYEVDTATRVVTITQPGYGAYEFYTHVVPDISPEVKLSAVMLTGVNSIAVFSNVVSTTKTDDISTWVLTGFDGEPIGTLPWGIAVTGFDYRLVIASASAYIQIRFRGSITSNAIGLAFTIPLIPVEVTSNAWSSYVYSGAREADLMQRRTQLEKSVEQGLINAPASIISGAKDGGALGAASSMVSTATNLLAANYMGNKYNAKFQAIADYRKANQTPGLLMSGTGFDVCRNGFNGINLLELKIDDYAKTQRDNDIKLYGVNVSEPTSICGSLILAGGPLQIDNLVVTGDIPVEAKDYISRRLAGGVRIV